MHPNNLLNIGTNPSTLVTLAFVFVILLILKANINWLIKMGYTIEVFDAPGDGKKAFRIKFSWTLILFVFIAIPWLLWGGYGPGQVAQLTAVEDTGAAKVVKEIPDPMTAVQKEADAEEKRPDVLRRLESNLDKEESADDIIQKAIRRYNSDDVEKNN